jgi:hypothetical protein
MNDVVRAKLVELVAAGARGVSTDAGRCRALLREQCPGCKDEIRALSEAISEQVVEELGTLPTGAPHAELLDGLTGRLAQNADLSTDQARWAVEAWALALGVITPGELTQG